MSNVTVTIGKDEWYPVWVARIVTPENPYLRRDHVEVPKDIHDRWRRAFAEFEAVQTEMIAVMEAHGLSTF